MFRAFVLSVLLSGVVLPSSLAQDHHQDHGEQHVFEVNGLGVTHPWARAAAAGGDTLVFFELHNEGAADQLLGASSAVAADVHIVGLTMGADGTAVQDVGAIEIPQGEFAFDPGGLALELHGLSSDLIAGQHFDLVLEFANAGPVTIEVAIEAADAGQHSHAGHSH